MRELDSEHLFGRSTDLSGAHPERPLARLCRLSFHRPPSVQDTSCGICVGTIGAAAHVAYGGSPSAPIGRAKWLYRRSEELTGCRDKKLLNELPASFARRIDTTVGNSEFGIFSQSQSLSRFAEMRCDSLIGEALSYCPNRPALPPAKSLLLLHVVISPPRWGQACRSSCSKTRASSSWSR